MKFQRIDPDKFMHLRADEADYSFEAKARFGMGGDSYGEWSNSRLCDKQGKNFIKEKLTLKEYVNFLIKFQLIQDWEKNM